jgi:heat shock protein HslJ
MARNAPSVRGTLGAVLGIVLAGGVLTGCGSSSATGGSIGPADLSGRSFVAHKVDDPHHSVVPGTHVQLSFTDRGLTVHAGCNTMSGQVTLDNGTLVVPHGLAMTEMGCPQPRMDQDEWVAKLLTSRPHVSLDGHQLVLTHGATTLTLHESS